MGLMTICILLREPDHSIDILLDNNLGGLQSASTNNLGQRIVCPGTKVYGDTSIHYRHMRLATCY